MTITRIRQFVSALSFVALCILAFVSATLSAHAQVGSNFRVASYIDDTIPPTAPTLNTVTPISTDQIDLSWGASTDNWSLSGYHIWRDGVQIATTTDTVYSDTGLTPSTTYAYYVTAYDSLFNESASSTEIATTTYATPPTPTPFDLAPISSSQINLVWGIPSSNWIFAGYHIWRDGVQIATTTDTFYADTGLQASTTYSYYVTAFDIWANESASSTEIATSTFPEAESETSSTRVRWFQNEPKSITVMPEQSAVVIRYETNDYIRAVVKWGETSSYELGSSLEHSFARLHETRIAGLRPGTRYQFTIEGLNRYGRYDEIYTGYFNTLDPDDVFPPGNVLNLTAVRSGNDVLLSWTNPTDPDFAKVRVVSSELFYPSDTADGWVVYEGAGTTATDAEVSQEGLWRYYTVFTYDALGNISSGAVVRVYMGEDEIAPEDEVPEIDPTLNEVMLRFGDLVFMQDGEVLPITDDWSVMIDGSKQLSILLPYEALPEHLKTILVVLEDSEDADKIFKFLLRINKDKTAYTSTLAPLGVSGTFPIQVSVFDFKTAQIGYADGILISEIRSGRSQTAETPLLLRLVTTFLSSYLFLGIFILIVLMYMGRRLMRKEW